MKILEVGGEISQNLQILSGRLGGAGSGGEISAQYTPGVVREEEVNRGDMGA